MFTKTKFLNIFVALSFLNATVMPVMPAVTYAAETQETTIEELANIYLENFDTVTDENKEKFCSNWADYIYASYRNGTEADKEVYKKQLLNAENKDIAKTIMLAGKQGAVLGGELLVSTEKTQRDMDFVSNLGKWTTLTPTEKTELIKARVSDIDKDGTLEKAGLLNDLLNEVTSKTAVDLNTLDTYLNNALAKTAQVNTTSANSETKACPSGYEKDVNYDKCCPSGTTYSATKGMCLVSEGSTTQSGGNSGGSDNGIGKYLPLATIFMNKGGVFGDNNNGGGSIPTPNERGFSEDSAGKFDKNNTLGGNVLYDNVSQKSIPITVDKIMLSEGKEGIVKHFGIPASKDEAVKQYLLVSLPNINDVTSAIAIGYGNKYQYDRKDYAQGEPKLRSNGFVTRFMVPYAVSSVAGKHSVIIKLNGKRNGQPFAVEYRYEFEVDASAPTLSFDQTDLASANNTVSALKQNKKLQLSEDPVMVDGVCIIKTVDGTELRGSGLEEICTREALEGQFIDDKLLKEKTDENGNKYYNIEYSTEDATVLTSEEFVMYTIEGEPLLGGNFESWTTDDGKVYYHNIVNGKLYDVNGKTLREDSEEYQNIDRNKIKKSEILDKIVSEQKAKIPVQKETSGQTTPQTTNGQSIDNPFNTQKTSGPLEELKKAMQTLKT